MTNNVRMEGLTGVLNTLRQLPPELVSKNGGVVRAALRKGAVIIRDEAQANVQKIIDAPNKDGLPSRSTGLLKKTIVVKRSAPRDGAKGETFIVSIRGKPYADRTYTPASRARGTRKLIKTRRSPKVRQLFSNDVGFMLEHGTETRPPMPWIRPAFETKKQLALATFETALRKSVDRVVRKLERQNRVRT